MRFGMEAGGPSAPFQIFEQVIAIQPEDIYGGHVNNARYFSYISQTFARWYEVMGFDAEAKAGPMMAHLSYDFLREMHYPGSVLCRLATVRLGRSSLEHAVEIRDAGNPDLLCGRGRGVHVWIDLQRRQSAPWPAEVAAKCWSAEANGPQEPVA